MVSYGKQTFRSAQPHVVARQNTQGLLMASVEIHAPPAAIQRIPGDLPSPLYACNGQRASLEQGEGEAAYLTSGDRSDLGRMSFLKKGLRQCYLRYWRYDRESRACPMQILALARETTQA